MMKHESCTVKARRHGFSRLEMLGLGGVTALCCVFLWPALAQNAAPEAGKLLADETDVQVSAKCMTNLKQIGLAAMQYVQDYDEKFPLVSARVPGNGDDDPTPVGWGDAIYPYMRSIDLLQCPAEKHASSMTRVKGEAVMDKIRDAAQLSGYTDYWYNANLTQIEIGNIESPALTVLFGDGDGGAINSNARYSLSSLPASWVKNPQSPAHRHREGVVAAYCFADGHVKMLPSGKVTSKAPSKLENGEVTFEEGLPLAGITLPDAPAIALPGR